MQYGHKCAQMGTSLMYILITDTIFSHEIYYGKVVAMQMKIGTLNLN